MEAKARGLSASPVRRSLQGGGDASSSASPPTAKPSCCSLCLCSERSAAAAQGRGGGIDPEPRGLTQHLPASDALTGPMQLSCRGLLRVLSRVPSTGLPVGVPADAAATMVPAEPLLQLVSCAAAAQSGCEPQPLTGVQAAPATAANAPADCCCWLGRKAACSAPAWSWQCVCGCGCSCRCCWACVRSCEVLGWMGRGLRPSSLLRLTGCGSGLDRDSCRHNTTHQRATALSASTAMQHTAAPTLKRPGR
jgi:hypothetical protein